MKDLDDFSKFLTDEELAKVAPMLERLTTLDKRSDKQENYMSFVKHVWPQFIEGRHHKIYAEKLQAVADGKKLVVVNETNDNCGMRWATTTTDSLTADGCLTVDVNIAQADCSLTVD